MSDGDEIEDQLIKELEEIKRRIAELQALEAQHNRAEKTLRRAQTRLKNQFEKQTMELTRARENLQTEEADREQAEELASLLVAAGRTSIVAVKTSIDAICVWSPADGKLLFCNRAFLEQWQIKGDYYDMYHSDCFDDDPKIGILQKVTQATISGGWSGEMTGRAMDGQTFPVLVNTSSILDKEGTVVGLLGIFKDITERKQAEEEKKLLISAVEQSIDGIAMTDLELRLTYVNAAYARMHGYSPGEMIGMKVTDMRNEEQLGELQDIVEKLRIKGFWQGESESIRKDGMPFPVYVTVTLLKDKEGNPDRFVAVARDITERKQAERALRESEAFSSSLLDNAPNPVMVYNPDDSVRYVNPALEKLTGFSSEEIIGRKPPMPWWPEELIDKALADFEESVCEGSRQLTWQFRRKNGERFWVELNSTSIKQDGEYKYHLSSWVDITERKQAEEALHKAYDELEIRVQKRTKELAEANVQLLDEIAERKFAEDVIEESEKRFSKILSSLFHLVFVLDTEGRLTYCYPARPELPLRLTVRPGGSRHSSPRCFRMASSPVR